MLSLLYDVSYNIAYMVYLDLSKLIRALNCISLFLFVKIIK